MQYYEVSESGETLLAFFTSSCYNGHSEMTSTIKFDASC